MRFSLVTAALGTALALAGCQFKGVADPSLTKRDVEWMALMPQADIDPIGARALYLFEGNRDTLYRIHGTNEPEKIGQAASSGCIRMRNIDVVELYSRVQPGTKVIVR